VGGGCLALRTDGPETLGHRERVDVYRYREKIERRARELGAKYDLDIKELIDRAERYANGLDEEDRDEACGLPSAAGVVDRRAVQTYLLA
jgi:hypothetical protein